MRIWQTYQDSFQQALETTQINEAMAIWNKAAVYAIVFLLLWCVLLRAPVMP